MIQKKHALSILIILLIISCNKTSKNDIYSIPVDETLSRLEKDEDTNQDKKITVDDTTDKVFNLKSLSGENIKIQSNYHLSNLLQILAEAKKNGQSTIDINLKKVREKPVNRISRLIKEKYWDNLTRKIDSSGLEKILNDSKSEKKDIKRLYVPSTDTIAIKYFTNLANEISKLHVSVLPKDITPEYVRSINDKPGILSLKLKNGKAKPFVVPGGRFNEMYGWDSYFEGIGLNMDGRQDLSQSMIENFAYEIEHYGKILNANRSYFLTRSQPPFLTSFIRETFEAKDKLKDKWLLNMIKAAMQEYFDVWMQSGKKMTPNGLNRYYANGIGIPPETEKGHFDDYLAKIADSLEITTKQLIKSYQNGDLKSERLDKYFLHDRSLRESGHDTSNRLINVCAHLNTVGLNSLLYKYETDFAYLIKEYFQDTLNFRGKTYTSQDWLNFAKKRKKLINKHLWDEEDKMFYDYNFKKNKKRRFHSATNYYPLWANIATKKQAKNLKDELINSLKAKGGILASTKESVEKFSDSDVDRQWDYPYGWAPHQMMLWKGLLNYGYKKEVQELVYRWLWMITKNAVDYNGTIPEKYNVVERSHKVYAEYGNVGTDFEYITPEGFGWMNASYQYGLSLLSDELKVKLNKLTRPETIFNN